MRRSGCVGVLSLVAWAMSVGAVWAQDPAAAVPNALKPQGRDGGWRERHQRYLDRAKQGDVGLLFLGDSITEGWEGMPKLWARYYEPRKAANFGISGDQTGQVLWRIEQGELKGINPKAVVLMIGTNNLGSDKDADIAAGIKAVVGKIREALPQSKILLLGVFPRSEQPGPVRERIKAINKEVATLDDGRTIKFLDIAPAFLEPDGSIRKEVMYDFLHLTPLGYQRWADAIEPTLWTMVDEK